MNVGMGWVRDAVCAGVDPDLFHGMATRDEAIHICRTHCPVRAPCLDAARKRPPAQTVQGGRFFNQQCEESTYGDNVTGPCRLCRWTPERAERELAAAFARARAGRAVLDTEEPGE